MKCITYCNLDSILKHDSHPMMSSIFLPFNDLTKYSYDHAFSNAYNDKDMCLFKFIGTFVSEKYLRRFNNRLLQFDIFIMFNLFWDTTSELSPNLLVTKPTI